MTILFYLALPFNISKTKYIFENFTMNIIITSKYVLNLFINRVAILNRDALWPSWGKKHYLQAAIVGGINYTGKILQ